MAGAEPSTDSLVEVLKEIRDELRAVRIQLASPAHRMTSTGIRTEVVDRAARWRNAALAGGGLALLALVLGVAMRERPAPAIVAVAPQVSATPAAKPATETGTPTPAVTPSAPAPVALAASPAAPATKSPQPLAVKPTAATKQAARSPAAAPAIASVPAPTKKRVKPDVAARPPAEVASDEDEAIAFPPPPRRVRAHRMSYGPVESEPAKL